MKERGSIFFLVICLLLALLPFGAMPVARTDTTTENKTLAAFPKIKQEGKWNMNYLPELGAYFEDHFAFRPLLVTADSEIQTKLFGVSNMDTVIVGTNGWLYYEDTLDDYLGQNKMSEREIFNAAHNISLLQKFVEDKGARFLFTAAPNKNSLYGQNMPYYAGKKESKIKNITLLKEEMKKWNISYADLFEPFEQEKEVLYLKRDSHWNQKGAVLAYHTLLEALGYEHETYETTKAIRTKTEYGDLNKMMYPLGAIPEWNYQYKHEDQYSYVTDTTSVEDAWIETSNEKGRGSLLMFRDSFGNTLLPLMADSFEKGYFSKGVPYQIEKYMKEYEPQTVIVEKVERNLNDFAQDPPIMTGALTNLTQKVKEAATDTSLQIEDSENDMSYWKISGILDDACVKPDTKVYVKLRTDEEEKVYEAFTVSNENTDNGYLLYLQKEMITGDSMDVEVIAETEGNLQSVLKRSFQLHDLSSVKE